MQTKLLVTFLSLSLLSICLIAGLPTSAAARSLELQPVAAGLDEAVALANAGDQRMFIVSKEGRVLILSNGVVLTRPFLDIRDRVLYTGEPESEQGLLALAFHPDYDQNGFLFVGYVDLDGDAVIARFSVSGPNPDVASSGSERILLTLPQPGPNHNLNHLAFGPDGYLYAASGDGGYQPEPRCTGQDGGSLLGKILRLDVDQNVDSPPYHAVPPDNPFVGAGEPLDEIWALGLRNPWRFSFDRLTGELWIADVGHRRREEVSLQPASSPGGENYGFKMMEGFSCRGNDAGCAEPVPPCFDPAYTPPIVDYTHDDRHCAIIGGHVYRGAAIPELYGQYLHGDYCGAVGLVRREGGSWVREELDDDLPEMVSFGEDAAGELYLLAAGTLYRLTGFTDATAPEPCTADAETLCLNSDRFRVRVSWRDFEGNTGSGRVVPGAADDSGLFWFFAADNWEFLVKVLDGCAVNGHYWVFAAATTNVEYTLEVFDSESGETVPYFNPLGRAAPATTDTLAFATCP